MDSQESIDNKYIIIEKRGSGATSNVFLVKKPNNENTYAGKVLKETGDLFDKEIEILKVLMPLHNPYLVNFIESGNGPIIRASKPTESKQYLILEYAQKGELFEYISCADKGFPEKYSKVIFSKILKGVQACHNAGICHRDLKMENILLDKDFNPKICDFGFATFNTDSLNEFLGTPGYVPPEILLRWPYDGFKADIFSLGVVLITLVTCKIGFKEATKRDPFYRLIMTKHFGTYWDLFKKTTKTNGLSDSFQQLFTKMVSFRPQERPSFEDILNSEWMREIRDLNNQQMSDLENEIRQEFLKREILVNEQFKKTMEAKEECSTDMSSGNRGGDDEKNYFDLSLKPKFAQTGIGMKNYIKINGEMNPALFMNNLCQRIAKKLENCEIDANENKLKFNVVFEEEEKEEEEEIPKELEEELAKLGLDDKENEEDDNITKKESVLQIKMFESINGGYLLRFKKKGGELEDYYKNLKKITALVQE